MLQNDGMLRYATRMGIERLISLDIGGTLDRPLDLQVHDEAKRRYLEENASFFSGIIAIDPGFPAQSLQKMEDWIEEGPCIGIKYAGGNQGGITCDHPNNDLIIEKAHSLGAVIYIHTWIKTASGEGYGSNNKSGESTPWQVAKLAQRFPDATFICGHAGGDWELGIRSIRSTENVFLEFAGSDPQSGGVDLAANELGTDRLVWGGHGPGRSYATELAKVLEANLSEEERTKVFGANYRHLAKEIFASKGIIIEP